MAVRMPSRLYRSRSEKMIAGVCGGLGEYFDVDPVLIRLLFVITALISGIGLLAYVVLWILVPREGSEVIPREQVLRGEVEELYHETRERLDPSGSPPRGTEPETSEASARGEPAGVADDVPEPPMPPTPYGESVPVEDRRRRRQHWAGAILIVIGVLFLAQNLGLLWWIQARYAWPLVLVGIGAWLLFGRGRVGRY